MRNDNSSGLWTLSVDFEYRPCGDKNDIRKAFMSFPAAFHVARAVSGYDVRWPETVEKEETESFKAVSQCLYWEGQIQGFEFLRILAAECTGRWVD